MFKRKKATNKNKIFQNSTQKILFTINNPVGKKGDIEVEEVQIDSDGDINEETKSNVNSSILGKSVKKSMHDLNDDTRAWTIPKSLSVNNNDHSKGLNIFLLRDKIIDQKDPSVIRQLEAVVTLGQTEIDNTNRVNYNTVLKDLSNNLHAVTSETVLIRTIELLQYRGSDSLVDNLSSYIDHSTSSKVIPTTDVYKAYDPTDLMSKLYVQIALKTCIEKLKQEGLLYPVTSERKPYVKRQNMAESRNKLHTRSVNRSTHSTSILR